MSGIVGIFRRDQCPVANSELARMTSAIAHRGPDGISMWHEAAVGLGHCMLWTTPESLHEKLPLARGQSQLAITADARIDNRSELIESLNVSNTEISDSELILLAYEKWGEQCPERLVGDFAFAIWDGKKRQIFSARDHFGVKPFYYHSSDRLFVFGTEIKALLALPEVSRTLNELRVAEHLSGFLEDKEITFYKDIQRLPPGHGMIADRGGIRLRRYWELDPTRELRMKSDDEYAEAVRELFTEAVRCRVRSAFPVGAMLSGGLDSSSITCTARDLLRESGKPPLHTFSAVFDNVPECDERQFIDAVLAQKNVQAHRLHVDQASPLSGLKDIQWHLDEVMTAGNLNIPWGVYGGAARKNGVRVILDGYDGDTTISHGTGLLRELAKARRWATLFKEGRGYAKHFDNLSAWTVIWTTIEVHGLHPRARKAVKLVRRLSSGLRQRSNRLLRIPNEPRFNDFLDQDFFRRIGFEEHRRAARTKNKQRRVGNERDDHYKRFGEAGIQNTLELLNRIGGAFSIDTRFPFWDKRLAEFCLALPSEQKLHDGWNRIVMRRAMENILPREVQWRGGKLDISQGLKYGMWTFERERIRNVIEKNSSLIENYVRVPVLREACQRFMNQKATDVDMFAIWKSVSLALWLQQSLAE